MAGILVASLLAAPLYLGFGYLLLMAWISEPDAEEEYWRAQFRRWQM